MDLLGVERTRGVSKLSRGTRQRQHLRSDLPRCEKLCPCQTFVLFAVSFATNEKKTFRFQSNRGIPGPTCMEVSSSGHMSFMVLFHEKV